MLTGRVTPLYHSTVFILLPSSVTMTTTQFASTPTGARYGFVLVHDTLCRGVIPAEWDGENQPVLYDTRAEAELERIDAAEMRADALRDARMEPENDHDGFWVEAAVRHADGALALIDLGVTFPAGALRELL
jgi:hypothetical protein